MWLFWSCLGLSSIVGIFYTTYYNPVLNLLLGPYLDFIGLKVGDTIYTVTRKLQVKHPLTGLRLVWVKKTQDGYRILTGWNNYRIDITPCNPNQTLKCMKEGKEISFPYETFTTCTLKEGEFVLYERKRGRLGFSNTEIARSKSWPIS